MIIIGPMQTLARADQVAPEEWAALQADPVFRNRMECVLGAGVFPAVSDLKECGTGMRHITGLILLHRDLPEGEIPVMHKIGWGLHPNSQHALACLLEHFGGVIK
ncbi:MAG: hypothetical protein V4621_07870 [Pseudomonadota bacterium]